MTENNNFYEKHEFPAIEQVELAEELTFSVPKTTEAKFYMKLMTPSIDTDKIIERNDNGFERTNYIILKIPGHILYTFMAEYTTMVPYTYGGYVLSYSENTFTIPKGTKFLVEFVGGILRLEHLAIVGIYYEDEDE